jgi:hypothetical protein
MSDLNRKSLEEEFGIDFSDDDEIIDIDQEGNILEKEKVMNAVKILESNIERANKILDRVEEEIDKGNFSSRLVEVAGQLINSVTNASKEMISDKNYNRYLQIREKAVLLERVKIRLKNKQLSRPVNQNIIIASREDILERLEDKREKESCNQKQTEKE